jgi:hypothetical protein
MRFNERIADAVSGGQLSQARKQSEMMQRTTEVLRQEVRGLTRKFERLSDGDGMLREDYAALDWITRLQQDREWALVSGAVRHRIIQKMEVEWYADLANYMWTYSPLIRRVIDVKTQFTFIKMFTVISKTKTLQNIIDAIMEDPLNRNAVFSKQAITEIDAELQKTGNIFVAVYTKSIPAMAQIRVFTAYEITDILYDPEDMNRPCFYLRTWIDNAGNEHQKLYPSAYNERPMINLTGLYQGVEIDRKVVVYHMSAKKAIKQKWALTELTPVLRWAKAHEGFLEDFGSIVKSIRKYSTMFTTEGGQAQVSGLASQLQGNPEHLGMPPQSDPAGSTVISEVGNDFKVVDAGSGKIVGAEDGRYFLLMICAGTGTPETVLMGDPSTGNLATAKELSGPFMDLILDRQTAWEETFRMIFTQILGKGATFEVSFPPIRSTDATEYIDTLISAFTLNGQKPSGSMLTRDFIRGIYESLEIDLPTDEELDKMVSDMEQMTQDASAKPSLTTGDAFNKLANAARAHEASLAGN